MNHFAAALTSAFSLAKMKLSAAVVAETALIAQTDTSSAGFLSQGLFDQGTTLAALALLAYILKLVLGGDLISQKTLDSVVEKSVRTVLEEQRRKQP